MDLTSEPNSVYADQYFLTSTPVLDLLRPLPRQQRERLSAGDYFFISSVVMVAFIELRGIRSLLDSLAGAAALAFWTVLVTTPVVAFLLSTAIHEIGHLVMARFMGFKAVRVKLGPFSIHRRPDQGLDSEEVMSMGMALLRPLGKQRLTARLAWLALGGPLASLLAPLAVEAGWSLVAAQPGTGYRLTSFGIHVFTVLSVLYGVASLMPDTDSSGNFSDGARLLMLLKNDTNARRWLAIVKLQEALSSGVHPREWEEVVVEQAVASNDESLDTVIGHWLAHLWAAGGHDLAPATRYLESALAASGPAPGYMRDRLFLEAAVFQAWYRHNAAKGRFWASQISRPGRIHPLQRQRLAIVQMWADGKPFDAWEKLGEYLQEVRKAPASPLRELTEKTATDWKHQMESRMLAGAWAMIHAGSQQAKDRTAGSSVN